MKRKARKSLALAILFVISYAGVLVCLGFMVKDFGWTSVSVFIGSLVFAVAMTQIYKSDMKENGRA